MAGAEQRKARASMKKGAFRLERSFLFSIKTMFAPNLHLDNHNPLFLLSVLVRMESNSKHPPILHKYPIFIYKTTH